MSNIDSILYSVEQDRFIKKCVQSAEDAAELEPHANALVAVQKTLKDILQANKRKRVMQKALKKFIHLERYVLLKENVYRGFVEALSEFEETAQLLLVFDEAQVVEAVNLLEEYEMQFQASLKLATNSIRIVMCYSSIVLILI